MSTNPEQGRLLKPIDGEAFRLLEDETRRRIVYLLRDNELTAKEISSALNLTVQNIYFHLRKLQDAGLIVVSEEKRSGHLIESYYTTTADTFVYREDEMAERSLQSFIDVLNGLNEMGVQVEVSEQNADQLSELDNKRRELMGTPSSGYDVCSICSFSGYFMKFGPMNPLLLNRILQYSGIISMTHEEFEESLDLTRRLRQFLISIKNPHEK